MVIDVGNYASDPSEAFLFLGPFAKQGLMSPLSCLVAEKKRLKNQ